MEFMQWRPCKPYIISMLASASAGELGKIVSAPGPNESRGGVYSSPRARRRGGSSPRPSRGCAGPRRTGPVKLTYVSRFVLEAVGRGEWRICPERRRSRHQLGARSAPAPALRTAHPAKTAIFSSFANSIFAIARCLDPRTGVRQLQARRYSEAFARIRRERARAQTSDATLDDLREAVTTLEEIEPIARRVLGSANPLTRRKNMELSTRVCEGLSRPASTLDDLREAVTTLAGSIRAPVAHLAPPISARP